MGVFGCISDTIEQRTYPWNRNHPKCSKEFKKMENNKIIKRHGRENKIPERNLHIYRQLIFNKGVKTIQWEKKSLLKKWGWDNCRDTCKSVMSDSCLIPYRIANSKRIKDLYGRAKTVTPRRNHRKSLSSWIMRWFLR